MTTVRKFCHAELVSASPCLCFLQTSCHAELVSASPCWYTLAMNYNNCAVYILTNKTNTTFYVGVTSNLKKRIYEHKNKLIKGFSSTYNTNKLVYFELTESIEAAIIREKQIKRWHRNWKINLIKELNPVFEDLSLLWES